jgi:uncharacterized protein with GYD domain
LAGCLLTWKAGGVARAEPTPSRRHRTPGAAAFKAAAKKMGVKVTGIYWTLGALTA